MRARVLIAGTCAALIGLLSTALPASSAYAQSGEGMIQFQQWCAGRGTWYPGPGYGTCVPSAGGGAPQLSAEEQRRQRDEKDLREAADDAWDRGVAAYKAGDWSKSVKLFSEAAQYAPDDPDIQTNLNAALRKYSDAEAAKKAAALKQAEAAAQAKAASVTGAQAAGASGTAAAADAGRGFDTNRIDAGGITIPAGSIAGAPVIDPVVPAARRTPKITALEGERTAERKKISDADAKLKTLDPVKDQLAVSKLKQERSNAEAKANYLNFSIKDLLDAPSAPAPKP